MHRTLAWGAINAIESPPTKPTRQQVALKLDYSGGYKSFKIKAGQFRGGCTRYDGPTLHWLVAACKASDGSYWALQNWQRALPNYGVAPSLFQAQYELWLSHWKGPLPVFEVDIGWSKNPGRAPDPAKVHSIWGRFTYLGKPIFGYGVDGDGSADRQLRARPVRRHVRLQARHRLAAREQLRHAQAVRDVLLRLLPRTVPHPNGHVDAATGSRPWGRACCPTCTGKARRRRSYDRTFDAAQLTKLQAFGDPDCG